MHQAPPIACANGQCDLSIFASRSILVHLARGVAGFLLIWWAVAQTASPVLSIGALALGMLAWRGCPMCWTVGLFETVRYRLKTSRF